VRSSRALARISPSAQLGQAGGLPRALGQRSVAAGGGSAGSPSCLQHPLGSREQGEKRGAALREAEIFCRREEEGRGPSRCSLHAIWRGIVSIVLSTAFNSFCFPFLHGLPLTHTLITTFLQPFPVFSSLVFLPVLFLLSALA